MGSYTIIFYRHVFNFHDETITMPITFQRYMALKNYIRVGMKQIHHFWSRFADDVPNFQPATFQKFAWLSPTHGPSRAITTLQNHSSDPYMEDIQGSGGS
jgi:hypothetical protein